MVKKKVSFRSNPNAGGSRPPKPVRTAISSSSKASLLPPVPVFPLDLGSLDRSHDDGPDPLTNFEYPQQPPVRIVHHGRAISPIKSRSGTSRSPLRPPPRTPDAPNTQIAGGPPRAPFDATEPRSLPAARDSGAAGFIRPADEAVGSVDSAIARDTPAPRIEVQEMALEVEIEELLRTERHNAQRTARTRRRGLNRSLHTTIPKQGIAEQHAGDTSFPIQDYEDTSQKDAKEYLDKTIELSLEQEFSNLFVGPTKPTQSDPVREKPSDRPGWLGSFLSRIGLTKLRSAGSAPDDIILSIPTAFQPPLPSPPSTPSTEASEIASDEGSYESPEESDAEQGIPVADEYQRPILKKALPRLSKEEVDEAADTQHQPARQKIIKGLDNEFLTGHDFNKLQPGDWLNDAIINAYVPLIAKTINQTSDPPAEGDPPAVLFFNTFLCARLEARRANNKPWREFFRGSLKKGIGGSKVLRPELIIIPVNEGSNHWTLLAVYPQIRQIHYLNSIRRPRSKHAELVKEWLIAQLLDAKLPQEDAANWEIVIEDVPQQNNGCDCGVFTLSNARLLAQGLSPHSTNQQNMDSMRYLITWELNKQELKRSSQAVRR